MNLVTVRPNIFSNDEILELSKELIRLGRDLPRLAKAKVDLEKDVIKEVLMDLYNQGQAHNAKDLFKIRPDLYEDGDIREILGAVLLLGKF